MNWWGQTLTRKFTLLLAGFLVLQALQLGVGIFGILHIGEVGTAINDAGKQRMRTLLLGNMLRQAVTADGWSGESQKIFARTLADYEHQFAEIGERTENTRAQDELRPLLTEARAKWENELKPLLMEVDPRRRAEANAALVRYEARVPDQVALLDRIVKSLDLDAAEDVRGFAIFHAVVLGLTLLLGIVGMIMARYIVMLPLRRLVEATRSIAAGAYDRRVTVSSRDEIGVLADTFKETLINSSTLTDIEQ